MKNQETEVSLAGKYKLLAFLIRSSLELLYFKVRPYLLIRGRQRECYFVYRKSEVSCILLKLPRNSCVQPFIKYVSHFFYCYFYLLIFTKGERDFPFSLYLFPLTLSQPFRVNFTLKYYWKTYFLYCSCFTGLCNDYNRKLPY